MTSTRSRRRPLSLVRGRSFVFTRNTVSLDVSEVLADVPAGTRLHINQTRGAIEFPGSRPAIGLQVDQVLPIVAALNRIRSERGETPVREAYPSPVWASIQRVARLLPESPKTPYEGRPRRVYRSRVHPEQTLYVDHATGERTLETELRISGAEGEPVTVSRKRKRLTFDQAAKWVFDEDASFVATALLSAKERVARDSGNVGSARDEDRPATT